MRFIFFRIAAQTTDNYLANLNWYGGERDFGDVTLGAAMQSAFLSQRAQFDVLREPCAMYAAQLRSVVLNNGLILRTLLHENARAGHPMQTSLSEQLAEYVFDVIRDVVAIVSLCRENARSSADDNDIDVSTVQFHDPNYSSAIERLLTPNDVERRRDNDGDGDDDDDDDDDDFAIRNRRIATARRIALADVAGFVTDLTGAVDAITAVFNVERICKAVLMQVLRHRDFCCGRTTTEHFFLLVMQ